MAWLAAGVTAAAPAAAQPIPEQTVPEQTVPENTGPENTGPENTGPENTGPENTAPLTAAAPRAFALGGARFRIDLPAAASLSADPGGSFVWIELAPGAEASPSLWLETPYDESQPFAFNARAAWAEGRALDYRASIGLDDFGEREAHLDGRLALGPHRWSVSCVLRRQNVEAADALWCLRYLSSVRPAT